MARHPTHSLSWLLVVYVLLMVLLGSTVLAAHLKFGALNLLISLVIAAAKAALVVLYFMHVRTASRVTWLFASAGLIWLSALFVLTLGEYVGRSRLSRTTPLSALVRPQRGRLSCDRHRTPTGIGMNVALLRPGRPSTTSRPMALFTQGERACLRQPPFPANAWQS